MSTITSHKYGFLLQLCKRCHFKITTNKLFITTELQLRLKMNLLLATDLARLSDFLICQVPGKYYKAVTT